MITKLGLHDVGGSILFAPAPPRDRDRECLPDCLIVFVHGFMSKPTAWRKAPRDILEALGAECAYFQYQYPSKFWQAADVRDAAADLDTYLTTTIKNYSHIVFLTHSTGAIVVKELLRRSATPAPQQARPEHGDNVRSLLERTRCIINLAGAHQGGRKFAWALMALYRITWGPVARLLPHVPLIGPRYGYFELGNQLLPNNAFLKQLNAEYDDILTRQASSDMPCPSTFDYDARNDGVVINGDKARKLTAGRFNVAYALHTLKSILRVAGSTLPERIFPQLLPGTAPPTAVSSTLKSDMAYSSLLFVRKFDQRQGIHALLSDEIQSHETARTQQEAFKEISEGIQQGGANIFVITGPGGTGKSVLMRRLAKTLAGNWLSSQASDNRCLPFVINMKRLVLRDEAVRDYIASGGEPALLWNAIQEAWVPVAHALRKGLMDIGEISLVKNDPQLVLNDSHRPTVTREWIDQCWRSGRTILFLDSVDEFLNSYRLLGGLDFVKMIRYLIGPQFGETPKQAVIAVRDGESETMRQLDPHWIRLDRLSTKGTLSFLDRTSGSSPEQNGGETDRKRERLKKVIDELPVVAQQTIATPLVLAKLPNLLSIADPTSLKTASTVMELALSKIIEDDPADAPARRMPQEKTWQNSSVDRKLDMLSVLGWIFACDPEGPYRSRPLEWIKAELARQSSDWRNQPDLPDIDAIRRLSQAFEDLSNEDVLEACLRRSVFQSIGGFVFDHRQWADLCIARFLSICIHSGVFQPLTKRTYHPSIFLRIADYLSVPPLPGFPASIRRTTIERMLAWLAPDPRDGQFVIGNFAAIMSHGKFGIDGDALAAIMNNLDRIPALAKHVVLSGFGYRALAGSPQDPTAGVLRTEIIPAAATHIEKLKPATASLIWCMTRALYGVDQARRLGNWPRPQAQDARELLKIVCPGFGTENDDLAQRISLQTGYVQTTMSMLQDEHRTIASVHYLFFAVVAHYGNAAVAETSAQLAEIFADANFETRLRSYTTKCPETLDLFLLAKNVFLTRDWT